MGRVLFIPSRNLESPVTRIRCHGFAQRLRARGIDCEVFPTQIPVRWTRGVDMAAPSLKSGVAIVRRLFDLRSGDVAYVVRCEDIPGVFPFVPILRRLGRFRLVFDFDDAVYETSPLATRALCRAADQVVVTNPVLESYARVHNGNVHTIPTPVETEGVPQKDWGRPNRVPVIGWAGTPSNYPLLVQELQVVLASLAKRFEFEIRIVTWPLDGVEELLPGRTRIIPWRLETYRDEIAQFDIGVSAVPDTAWTRGKMGFKLLEYMAAGVPAVGSRLFAAGGLFTEGEGGLWAEGAREWEHALTRLLEDDKLRQRIGQAGRRVCEESFSLSVAAKRVEAVVRPLLQ